MSNKLFVWCAMIGRQCPGKPSVEIFRNQNKRDGASTLEDKEDNHNMKMQPFFGFGRRNADNNSSSNNNDIVSEVMGDIFKDFFAGPNRGTSSDRAGGGGTIFDEFQRMHNEFDVFRKQFENENHPHHRSQQQREQQYDRKYQPPHRSNNENISTPTPKSSSTSSSAQQRFKEYSKKKTFEL
jgi:hypothetical protein